MSVSFGIYLDLNKSGRVEFRDFVMATLILLSSSRGDKIECIVAIVSASLYI